MIEIDQALLTSYINASYGLPIAHENIPYDPTVGTAYAELLVLQNELTARNLKDSDETNGIFRVILRYPVNTGAIAVKTMADSILNTFSIGSKHSYGSTVVIITSGQRSTGVAEEGWFKLVVSMRYRSFISR